MSQQITHEIPQQFREHIRALLAGIETEGGRQLMLRGQVLMLQKQIEEIETGRQYSQREVNNLVVSLAAGAQISNPTLSPDGTQIIGDAAS